jgi:hypothetical protein
LAAVEALAAAAGAAAAAAAAAADAAAAAAGVAGALPPLVVLLLVDRRARAMTSESAERATSEAAAAATGGAASLLLVFRRKASLGSGIFSSQSNSDFLLSFFAPSAIKEKKKNAMEAFDRFDFDASPAWKRYQEDSVLTTDIDALLLAKAKWYKKNVAFEDEAFDVDLVRRKISSRGGGAATASGGCGGSSSRSAPAPPPPPPPPSQPKPTTRKTPAPPAAASESSRGRTTRPLSGLSAQTLLSSISSASPAAAAALASRLATLVTGLAFLLACASAWLSFFGLSSSRKLPADDFYSPRSSAAPASAAAFRRFALSASVAHLAALLQRVGSPPVAALFRAGGFNPQAMGPVLAWLRRASEAPDAGLLFFLALSASSPSAAAAVPSLVAALFALLESSSGAILFPGPLRSLLESRKRPAARAAAAAELAQGMWLVLSTVLGRGGGFLTAMGFWRTYAPMRLRSGGGGVGSGSSGGDFRAAAVALAGGAARAARKVGGGGGRVAAFLERLEARLRSQQHSD